MTNFEKFLKWVSIENVAEALSLYFEGQCGECPARGLCEEIDDESDVGCMDVMKQWLEQEAEGEADADVQ